MKVERTKKAEPPISSFVDVGSENADCVDGEAVDAEVEAEDCGCSGCGCGVSRAMLAIGRLQSSPAVSKRVSLRICVSCISPGWLSAVCRAARCWRCGDLAGDVDISQLGVLADKI